MQESTNPQQPVTDAPPTKGKKRKVFGFIFVGFAVAAIVGFFWYLWAHGREDTDDAYVDGHISTISSRVSGTVLKVFVKDNQDVKAGDLLVSLDPRDNQVEVDQLKAGLEEAQFQAAAAQSKIGQSSLSAQGQSTQASGSISSTQADIESARAQLMQAQEQVKQSRGDKTALRSGKAKHRHVGGTGRRGAARLDASDEAGRAGARSDRAGTRPFANLPGFGHVG
jgi:membrane fusion protein (multidrug efflux system)